ncbi:MAG: AzlD domain-containing protein [Firmicutes bacterium]|nr:AzlD domain-containing protein [Bacillota bacterium]
MTDAAAFALITIVICGLVTQALRFLPFALFSGGRGTPRYVAWLGKVLPYAIMGMLCVYCLRDVTFSAASGWAPSAIAVALVIALQAWKHNSLLSIGAGTICYMFLVQAVFV